MGRLDEAAARQRKAIELDPKSAAFYLGPAGLNAYGRNRFVEAVPLVERAVALDAGNPELPSLLALLRRVPHLRREVFRALKPHRVDECPFFDLPNSKASRWGGGVSSPVSDTTDNRLSRRYGRCHEEIEVHGIADRCDLERG
jgi:tetratricopeptide (TPR) repeat protein